MRNKLVDSLSWCGQEHLIDDFVAMNESDFARCLQQIQQWSLELVSEQKRSWQTRRSSVAFESLADCPNSHEQPISAQPRIGVLILAGGQGSRLGISGPKGCFPLLGKSLFERHAEKIRAKQAPLAIMTSSLNYRETVAFFESNCSFGLQDVTFFSQKTLPLFDESGRWFWEECGRIAEGADGNGSVFQSFLQAGIWNHFIQKGVELVHIVPVDNPLADPFDPAFLSFHQAGGGDLSVKCFRLADPEESAGRLVLQKSKLMIAEFAELTDEQRHINLFANTGLLAIDIHLMRDLANKTFPLHWAWRPTTHWENGMVCKKNSWKAERFIVDALLYANKGRTICYPRGECYAPLKEKSSIAQIEHLLNRESVNRIY